MRRKRPKRTEFDKINSAHFFRTTCEHLYGIDVTNVDLAKHFGCSEAAIRNWESGAPLNGILIKLLEEKGISSDYLLNGTGPMLKIDIPHQTKSLVDRLKIAAKRGIENPSLPSSSAKELLAMKAALLEQIDRIDKLLEQ